MITTLTIMFLAALACGAIAAGITALCGAGTQTGSRCLRIARGIGRRCYQHGGFTLFDGVAVALLTVVLLTVIFWFILEGPQDLIDDFTRVVRALRPNLPI